MGRKDYSLPTPRLLTPMSLTDKALPGYHEVPGGCCMQWCHEGHPSCHHGWSPQSPHPPHPRTRAGLWVELPSAFCPLYYRYTWLGKPRLGQSCRENGRQTLRTRALPFSPHPLICSHSVGEKKIFNESTTIK